MIMELVHITEGLRIFRRRLKVASRGIKRYKGDPKSICRQIVDDCWNGEYFQVSDGHFSCFYMRDFGFFTDSLLRQGYREKVLKTLDHVMEIYSRQKLTTTITRNRVCTDFFSYSPDSLAYLLRSLRSADAGMLVKKYKKFLEKEAERFERSVMDKETGMVRQGKFFSSIRDQSIRSSSVYNNVMAAMAARELGNLGIKTSLDPEGIRDKIREELWNGEYFFEDMKKTRKVAGDANIFPFLTDVFTDRKMLKSCLDAIQKEKLDQPFPLSYSREDDAMWNLARVFVKDYEGRSIWMHMGPLYISLLKKIYPEKARKMISIYSGLIRKHRNYLEVFYKDGTPFRNSFYYSDESMLWAVMYLDLVQES